MLNGGYKVHYTHLCNNVKYCSTHKFQCQYFKSENITKINITITDTHKFLQHISVIDKFVKYLRISNLRTHCKLLDFEIAFL